MKWMDYPWHLWGQLAVGRVLGIATAKRAFGSVLWVLSHSKIPGHHRSSFLANSVSCLQNSIIAKLKLHLTPPNVLSFCPVQQKQHICLFPHLYSVMVLNHMGSAAMYFLLSFSPCHFTLKLQIAGPYQGQLHMFTPLTAVTKLLGTYMRDNKHFFPQDWLMNTYKFSIERMTLVGTHYSTKAWDIKTKKTISIDTIIINQKEYFYAGVGAVLCISVHSLNPTKPQKELFVLQNSGELVFPLVYFNCTTSPAVEQKLMIASCFVNHSTNMTVFLFSLEDQVSPGNMHVIMSPLWFNSIHALPVWTNANPARIPLLWLSFELGWGHTDWDSMRVPEFSQSDSRMHLFLLYECVSCCSTVPLALPSVCRGLSIAFTTNFVPTKKKQSHRQSVLNEHLQCTHPPWLE